MRCTKTLLTRRSADSKVLPENHGSQGVVRKDAASSQMTHKTDTTTPVKQPADGAGYGEQIPHILRRLGSSPVVARQEEHYHRSKDPPQTARLSAVHGRVQSRLGKSRRKPQGTGPMVARGEELA